MYDTYCRVGDFAYNIKACWEMWFIDCANKFLLCSDQPVYFVLVDFLVLAHRVHTNMEFGYCNMYIKIVGAA